MSPTKILAPCSVDECDRPYYSTGYCKLHYNRVQKGNPAGTAERMKAEWGTGNVRPDGYARVHDPSHRLAAPDGRVYIHRRTLYDLIGPGHHRCHWCSRLVEWNGMGDDRLVVDHLDFDPTNNDPANLVPSCHSCNSGRTRRWQ